MKIAFIGDTHHNEKAINEVIKYVNEYKIDILIHLGDCVSDLSSIRSNFEGTIYAVAGNCDYTTKYPREQIIEVNTKKIFFTHGDAFNVKSTLNSLSLKGESLGANIILYGHTHIPIKEYYKDILIMNPGSIPKPSPCVRYGCIGYIEIDENGKTINSTFKKVILW